MCPAHDDVRPGDKSPPREQPFRKSRPAGEGDNELQEKAEWKIHTLLPSFPLFYRRAMAGFQTQVRKWRLLKRFNDRI